MSTIQLEPDPHSSSLCVDPLEARKNTRLTLDAFEQLSSLLPDQRHQSKSQRTSADLGKLPRGHTASAAAHGARSTVEATWLDI